MADIAKAKRNVSRMIDGGASEQEIDSYLASEGLNAETLRTGGKRTLLQDVSGAATQFNKMIPFGDELAAGLGTAVDVATGQGGIGESWQRQRQAQKELDQGFDQAHPNAAALSRGVGLAANAAIPIGGTTLGGGRLLNAARGAVIAGNQGALSAFADEGDLGERFGAASKASVDPLTLGLGAAFGARAVPSGRGGKAIPADQLRQMKQAAYQDVDNLGARYSQQDYDALLSDIEGAAKQSRLVKDIAPRGVKTLKNFQKNPMVDPSLSDIEQMRQIVNRNIPMSEQGPDKVYGNLFREKLDDFIDTASPIGAQQDEVTGAINNARGLNSRYRKTDAIEKAVEDAKLSAAASGSGSNIDNALRQQVRKVYGKTKGLTEEERKAYERVIKGGPGQNVLRAVGKLSPQNGLMMSLGIGGVMANPLLGVPLLAGGAAKSVADSMTKRNVNQLLKVVSQGASVPNPVREAARRLLAFKAAQQVGVNRGNKEK